MFNDSFESIKRSWTQQFAIQVATLLVLTASFTVVCFSLLFIMNFKSVLLSWGDSIRISCYLKDSLKQEQIDQINKNLMAFENVKQIEFVDKDKAAKVFKEQMSSYAPALLAESEFGNPFPASFVITLKESVQGDKDMKVLEETAEKIRALPGVEDVSYGQNWVKNYSHFVQTLSGSIWIIILTLLGGSLLVISNSIRAGISTRKIEIEILELVGATAAMIRKPFIFEGVFMSFIAIILAIFINFEFFLYIQEVMSANLSFTHVHEQISFFNIEFISIIVGFSILIGALSSYWTVRKFNSGWAAAESQKI